MAGLVRQPAVAGSFYPGDGAAIDAEIGRLMPLRHAAPARAVVVPHADWMYSGTVAGFMNMIGNLGTVFAAPTGHWIARRSSVDGVTENWTAALAFYAVMFGIACGCWLFIDPRRVVVYSPVDRERLRAEGSL